MNSTFAQDFTIADHFGATAIQDTFNRAFKEWRTNYKMLTELVIALNLKIWEHYEKGNQAYTELYNTLWGQADTYALDNLKGEELTYFINTTD